MRSGVGARWERIARARSSCALPCWLAALADLGSILPILANRQYPHAMSTMNISLPESLKAFVDEQVTQGGYGTSSEYIRELIRRDQDRRRLRGLLLAGAASAPEETADEDYFERLRSRVRKAARAGRKA
jgi:antitoxin ParD1/3/4